jgi:hypothetical protein
MYAIMLDHEVRARPWWHRKQALQTADPRKGAASKLAATQVHRRIEIEGTPVASSLHAATMNEVQKNAVKSSY